MSRAPLIPSGWPKPIAPPFTFSFASSNPIVSRVAIGTEANASLTSHRSMSSGLRSTRASALRIAGIVPSSMIVGFVPATPVEVSRARGSSFSSFAVSGFVIRIAQAPSLMPLELPAVIRPSGLKAGGRDASFSRDVFLRVEHPLVAALVDDRHRNDLPLEPALVDRADRLAVGPQRELVHLLSRHMVLVRHEVGRDALLHDLVFLEELRAQGAAVRAERDAGHRLDAARDDDVRLARHHFHRCEVERLQAGGAHP